MQQRARGLVRLDDPYDVRYQPLEPNIGFGTAVVIASIALVLALIGLVLGSVALGKGNADNNNLNTLINDDFDSLQTEINNLVTQVGSKLKGFGNVAIVDQILGNDATGAVSGLPFKTIRAALAKLSSGQAVFLMPGQYNENFTVPTGVTIKVRNLSL